MGSLRDPYFGVSFIQNVGFGTVAGYERWAMWANNPDVDTADTPSVITPGAKLSTPPFWTVPGALEIVSASTADVGIAVTMELLNATYDRVYQTVALNGTTPVAVPGGAVYVAANNATTSALTAGIVSIRDSGAGTVRLPIPVGRGVSQSSWRTVPNGYTVQLEHYLVSINRTVTAGRWATVTAAVQTWTGSAYVGPVLPFDIALSDASLADFNVQPGLLVPQRSRVWAVTEAVSGNNTDLTAVVWGIMKSNAVV